MAKSFLDKNMTFDKILSFGLLATTALYFDKKKLAFIIAAPFVKQSVTISMNYVGYKLGYGNAGKKYFKYIDPIFDITMYCFKEPMQDAAVNCFGEVYGLMLGKAGALCMARINQEFADSLFSNDSKNQSKEPSNFNEKLHLFLHIFSAGVHIALNSIVKDVIDSRLKIPVLSVGIIASSALLYFIKPTEYKGGDPKYSGVLSYAASHFVLVNGQHLSFKFLSSTSKLSGHKQFCHFITTKAKTCFSNIVRDCTNLLGK